MRILFVCTGNTCRSPMAEAIAKDVIARAKLDSKVLVSSAGLHASDGDAASSGAVLAMKNRGLDLSHHSSRKTTKELLASVDRIYTMTNGHRRQLVSAWPEFAQKTTTIAGTKDIGDPFGASLEIYEHVANEIEREVKRIVAEITRDQ